MAKSIGLTSTIMRVNCANQDRVIDILKIKGKKAGVFLIITIIIAMFFTTVQPVFANETRRQRKK